MALALAFGNGAKAQPRSETGIGLGNPVTVLSLDRLSATRDRPLFSPSRRPPTPALAPVPTPVVQRTAPTLPPVTPSVDLFGIVKDDVKGTRAVVRASPNSKIVLVRVGDNIDGWKVSQIDVRKLVLSLGERSTAFTLFSGKSATPNVTPVRRPPTVLDLAAIGRRLQQAAYRRR